MEGDGGRWEGKGRGDGVVAAHVAHLAAIVRPSVHVDPIGDRVHKSIKGALLRWSITKYGINVRLTGEGEEDGELHVAELRRVLLLELEEVDGRSLVRHKRNVF